MDELQPLRAIATGKSSLSPLIALYRVLYWALVFLIFIGDSIVGNYRPTLGLRPLLLQAPKRRGEAGERPDRGGGDGGADAERQAGAVGQPPGAAPTEGERGDLAAAGGEGSRRAKAPYGTESPEQLSDLNHSPKSMLYAELVEFGREGDWILASRGSDRHSTGSQIDSQTCNSRHGAISTCGA